AGVLAPLDGFIKLGANVQPGYLAQIREAPIPGATVMDAILAAARVENGPARSYLARFLFRGEDVLKPVSELSGGERSRLELALLGITPANLLLLDEPTNHLDIPAREALESFLRSTESTMLIVSHDRRLLESVCGSLWVVAPGEGPEPGKVARFDGGYTAWRAAVADGWTVETALARAPIAQRVGGVIAPPVAAPVRPTTVSTSSNGKRSATRQPPLSKDAYKRQIGRVEEDLTRLGVRKNQLELALGDSKVQANFVELRRLTSELADVDGVLAQAEEAWLALSERAPR
ncbi:MAG: ATP-binding cassette domain-containing protein, partial [Chloroflexi bacterium]|nr:ATP-binding cassette domain-containing protein [Chloroflexota bacterium]